MTLQKLALVYGYILLICLILLSCTSPANTPTSSFDVIPNQTSTLIMSNPTVASTLTINSTANIIPTLPIDQANFKFLELLANNGNCQLPCVWGITPGQSSYIDAQNILVPLSSISNFTDLSTSPGDISPMYTDGDNILAARMAFLFSMNGVINHITFQIGIMASSSEFSKKIENYTLQNILSQHGNPTKVMLSTMAKLPSSGVPDTFKILLLYPDQGILVNYTMQMQIVGENIMGCPSDSSAEFELYASGQSNSFFDFLEPTGWPQIIENTYKPIDEVTAMTKDDFYQLFSEQTEECVLTPASLWPIPN